MYPAGREDIETRMVQTRDGHRLHVAVAGDVGAAPVLMLHGWAGSLYAHRCALDRLPARDIRVIAPDLRGHGRSDKPMAPDAYRLEAYLEDVRVILDAFGIERAVLFGQSMGGAVALHAALAMPERVAGLILAAPAGLTPLPIASVVRLIPPRLLRRMGPAVIRRWMVRQVLRRLVYADADQLSEADVDQYWAPSADPGYAYAARTLISEFDWSPVPASRLRTIACPTLLIMGSADRLVRGVGDAASAIPNLRLVTLRAGHGVNEELGEAVCRLTGDFVASELGSPSTEAGRSP